MCVQSKPARSNEEKTKIPKVTVKNKCKRDGIAIWPLDGLDGVEYECRIFQEKQKKEIHEIQRRTSDGFFTCVLPPGEHFIYVKADGMQWSDNVVLEIK